MFIRNAHGEYSQPREVFTGKTCSVKGCTKSGCDRGHVRKCDSEGNYISRQVYIIPLCTKHNRSKTDEVLEVKAGTNFVAINE